MAAITAKNFRIALIQLAVTADKALNLSNARNKVLEAAKAGSQVVVLPEIFNSPYGVQFFDKYAENIPNGPSTEALSAMARDAAVYLIGGSIPERDSSSPPRLYNTCPIFSPTGKLLATHRKVHLFDIEIPGKIRFKESEVLTGGDSLTLVETEYGKLGIGICYDIRFPEMAMIAARKGAVAMIYPGAFNTVTGPLHWDLLQRGRANDNQIWVAMCSPARNTNPTPETGNYEAWGHSQVTDANGIIVSTTEEKEAIVYADVDVERVKEVRSGIPITVQRRFDVYADVSVCEPTAKRKAEQPNGHH
ncbi:carbon-nitrogen hydrolase [Hyaloraphidium curvatum]|nr:carbon-nitrogen hydrolase [Hyaloraphidium curvatum]